MRKILLFLLFSCFVQGYNFKLLHMSFHSGCTNDFDEVAKELGIDVTNWIISDQMHFEGRVLGNAIYNLSQERGTNLWNRHKDYFNQFDVILTSDTARLSRIFLENGWDKPLIIWICNRFDYIATRCQKFGLPDDQYYETFKAAMKNEKVKIISYTEIEYRYARAHGVRLTPFTIKPIGAISDTGLIERPSVPLHVNKKENLFLFPRLYEGQPEFITQKCAEVGLSVYTGVYDGPNDLVDFKAVLYFPYAWSNLALFENIQRGIIHFVPSKEFVLENHKDVRYLTLTHFDFCEWYTLENRNLFVYFDSWQDLAEKVKNLDYDKKCEHILLKSSLHRVQMLDRWRGVFDTVQLQLAHS